MERIYYDVHAHGPGWRVQTLGAGWDYPSRSDAMARAISYARHQWELCRLPSGVRERGTDGQWREAGRFGTESGPPDPHAA